MAEALRVAVVNAAFDRSVTDCERLLDRYETLTDWCSAMTEAGAAVRVVQRFSHGADRHRCGAEVTFVADGFPPTPSPGARLASVAAAVAETVPHVVHVNGLGFPRLVAEIRRRVERRVPIVVQDHAGVRPPSLRGPVGWWRRARWRQGLSAADAVSFSSEAQAAPWRGAGILDGPAVLAILESSTRLRPTPRAVARQRIGVDGRPLVLWVGRLVPNKDPLTVLAAFDQVAGLYPNARFAMVFQNGTLVDEVTRSVSQSPRLRSTVTLVGPLSREAIADWYGAADVFVSGSHAEGSGYALIEAMASGLIPVVTAIPSFAAIAGPCGDYWPPGDMAACAAALGRACERDHDGASVEILQRFARELSWPCIGERTIAAYRRLVADRDRREERG